MFKMYYEDGDYRFECWGASTKHPDTVDRFSDWNDKSDIIEPKYQIFQWLLWIASRKMFPFHAEEVVSYAYEHWYNFM